MAINVAKLKNTTTPMGMPFRITKLGHVVVQVSDLERSVNFYTQILGFKVSDVYPEEMMPGGMVFLRCHTDHHCLALVGSAPGQAVNKELHHFAFEVATLDELVRARDHLRAHKVPIDFEGRRRAGQAEEGITSLRNECDTLIVIPNDRLLALGDRGISMMDAFRQADAPQQHQGHLHDGHLRETGSGSVCGSPTDRTGNARVTSPPAPSPEGEGESEDPEPLSFRRGVGVR